MKAIQMTATGGPEVLQSADIDMPEIERPDQVKIRVIAAGVNPIDTKLRSRGTFFPDSMPAVLGCDGAGVVEAVGEQVTGWQIGDKVMALLPGGGYAEQVAVHHKLLLPLPERWTFVQGAAVPEVWLTAFVNL